MASVGRDTCGSQFYITLGPNPQMDGRCIVIGRVIGGEEVLSEIEKVPNALVALLMSSPSFILFSNYDSYIPLDWALLGLITSRYLLLEESPRMMWLSPHLECSVIVSVIRRLEGWTNQS